MTLEVQKIEKQIEELAKAIHHLYREIQLIESLLENASKKPSIWLKFPDVFLMTYQNSWDKLYLLLYKMIDATKGTLSLTRFLRGLGETKLAHDLDCDPLVKKIKEWRSHVTAHTNELLILNKDSLNKFYDDNKSHVHELRALILKLEQIVRHFEETTSSTVGSTALWYTEIQPQVDALFIHLEKGLDNQVRPSCDQTVGQLSLATENS